MKTTRILAVAALVVAGTFVTHATLAQQWGGIKRSDVMRSDFSVPGREVIQVLVEFGPGVVAPKHAHPGEEIAYVIRGSLVYALDGRPPVTLHAGDALFIPYGTPHAVTNVGSGSALELATYIVEKGKPLAATVQ